jgi:putative FmdB family regulatory protein
MPIYAYRCAACGAEKDVLQKISDEALTVCPVCAAESFHRVLTAPAFQLKGSGWYVTDFRDGNKAKQAATASGNGAGAAKTGDAASSKSDAAKTDAGRSEGSAKSGDSPSSGSAGTGTGAD